MVILWIDSTSLVVGKCFLEVIMQAHMLGSCMSTDGKMIENWLCTFQHGWKINPFISILSMGPHFRYMPTGSFYLFMVSFFYIMVLWYRKSKSPISDFLLIEIFWSEKVDKIKIIIVHTWPSIFPKIQPSNGNTRVVILSPTTKLTLAVQCFPVVSVWIHSEKIVKRSLKMQSITSSPLL